jgi:hypothetical protein
MELQTANFEPEPSRYEPPTLSSIHLLTLFNINGQRGQHVAKSVPVEGVLRTVDLADEPVYKALWYTWGTPSANTLTRLRTLMTRSGY